MSTTSFSWKVRVEHRPVQHLGIKAHTQPSSLPLHSAKQLYHQQHSFIVSHPHDNARARARAILWEVLGPYGQAPT